MQADKRLKGFLIAGALTGAGITIAVSLLMDVLYADVLGGTWRDAIVKDLDSFAGVSVDRDSLVVSLILLFIFLILGLFGAFIGLVFTFFIYRFLSLLVKR